MIRTKLSLTLLLGISLPMTAALHQAAASEYEDTPTEAADGIHIPKSLTLLEETPFYVIPNALKNKAEGSFSPQVVEVVEAETGWATNPSWWKIHTSNGDRWVKTYPQSIDVPPPPSITLLENTPIYANPKDNIPSSAVLSPQEVVIAGAEKQWFYSPSYKESRDKWLKIQTSWLGDQWIHLPVKKIGSYQAANKRKYYAHVEVSDFPFMNYPSSEQDATYIENQILSEAGEFRSPAGSIYQIHTDKGLQWTPYSGQLVIDKDDTIQRHLPAPLFPAPSEYAQEPILIAPQTLKVFEEIQPYQFNRANNVWYHVKANEGEGWFNPRFADPEDAKPESATIELRSTKTGLLRYPDENILLNNGILGPQSLHPLASWTNSDGIQWFQISTFLGNAWITLNPQLDRIHPAGRELDKPIIGDISSKGALYLNDNNLTFGNAKVGYDLDGQLYLDSAFLAKMYHYVLSGPSPDNKWTFDDGLGYSFQIKPGEQEAVLFWQGGNPRKLPLSTAPTSSSASGVPNLGIEDMRTLLGATTQIQPNHSEVILSEVQYTFEAFNPPAAVEGNTLHLSVLSYDNERLAPYEVRNSLKLYVYDRNSSNLPGTSSEPVIASNKRLYYLNYATVLNDISLNKQLKPGVNHLKAVFKVGERVLLERDFDVQSQ
ncbi:hypothetical protein [Paenibacillus alba]|uniref:Uncharacterized protein n=1 Tax=Paenibacillus alba TaxID=1197127 RepID=A0ABU6G307_9BACL|nr:hypothetical protein [Paenibacillus alba]MEC0228545.1 hypothetical protein [Paenibacillus alba]